MKITRKCSFCGKSFVTRSGVQRYCSEACQVKAKRSETEQKNTLFKVARPLIEIQHQEYFTFSSIIGCLSFLLLKTSDIFRKAVNCIIRLAKDYYKPRSKYLTSRVPLTCLGMTGNPIELPGISCASPPSKRAGLTTGSKSKPDRK